MPIVISTRRLEPIYNVETFIKAMPLILKQAPSTFFMIVGNGSQETMLKKLAEQLNVASRITWLGTVKNDELPQILNDADIYVSTSLSDGGLAISTCEAMACGLPVVVTDICDNRRWIHDGVNGFLVPPQNSIRLAEAVIFLLEHDDVRESFGLLGRRTIIERNNLQNEVSKLENLYSNKLG